MNKDQLSKGVKVEAKIKELETYKQEVEMAIESIGKREAVGEKWDGGYAGRVEIKIWFDRSEYSARILDKNYLPFDSNSLLQLYAGNLDKEIKRLQNEFDQI